MKRSMQLGHNMRLFWAVQAGAGLLAAASFVIAFHAPAQAQSVVVNTVVVLPKRALQLATFSFGTSLTDEHRRLHTEFIGHTQLK